MNLLRVFFNNIFADVYFSTFRSFKSAGERVNQLEYKNKYNLRTNQDKNVIQISYLLLITRAFI